MFHTDADRILFLLETEAELSAFLADEALEAEAGEERPKYIYVIWNTPLALGQVGVTPLCQHRVRWSGSVAQSGGGDGLHNKGRGGGDAAG